MTFIWEICSENDTNLKLCSLNKIKFRVTFCLFLLMFDVLKVNLIHVFFAIMQLALLKATSSLMEFNVKCADTKVLILRDKHKCMRF